MVVNATGPFADGIRKMAEPQISEIIKPAGGVHVVLPDHFCPDRMGLIVPKTKDGRGDIIFIAIFLLFLLLLMIFYL